MTTGELLAVWREEVDDVQLPYSWSDALFCTYLNDALEQAVRRAFLLTDDHYSNPTLCDLALTAGVSMYSPSEYIVRIQSAKISTNTIPLIKTTKADLSRYIANWEVDTAPMPTHWVFDHDRKQFWVYPQPTVALTCYLEVVRLPQTKMRADALGVAPEIDSMYHMDLLDWVKHRCFGKVDSDVYDEKLAEKYEKSFEMKFGKLPSAFDEQMRQAIGHIDRIAARRFGT